MTATNAGAFAAGVSRALTKQGMRALPSGTPITREGIRVRRGHLDGHASVSIDIDLPRKAKRMGDDVVIALWLSGYEVERATDTQIRVTRAELGTSARPIEAKLGDTCPKCITVGELWSSYFLPDGNGGENGSDGSEVGARYLTMCQSCSTFFETGQAAPR
jgi:hypothetical protein